MSVALAGCSATVGSDGQVAEDASVEPSMAVEQAEAGAATTDMMAFPGEVDSAAVESSIIMSSTASLITSDPQESAAEFTAYVLSVGGRIDSSSHSEFDSSPYASVIARVPATTFDEVVAELSQFGKVQSVSTFNEDVGRQVADLQARIDVLNDSIARLRELMEQASGVDELIAAENGLTERQAELDSLQAQLTWLDDQVEMSTVYVDFMTEADSSVGFSFAKAWEYFLRSLQVVAYGVLIALPWAALVAILVFAVRTVRAKRKSTSKVVTAEEFTLEEEEN